MHPRTAIVARRRAAAQPLDLEGLPATDVRAAGGKNLGIVCNFEWTEPQTDSEADKKAAHTWDGIFNRWFLDGLHKGQYPADILDGFGDNMPRGFEEDMKTVSTPIDWMGVNYYTRGIYAHDPSRDTFPLKKIDGPLEKTDIGWEIYPEGLEKILVRIHEDYVGDLPLFVTENGMAEVEGDDDPRRVRP